MTWLCFAFKSEGVMPLHARTIDFKTYHFTSTTQKKKNHWNFYYPELSYSLEFSLPTFWKTQYTHVEAVKILVFCPADHNCRMPSMWRHSDFRDVKMGGGEYALEFMK